MDGTIEKRIDSRICSLETRIHELDIPRLTNTYKRQEEQRRRDQRRELCVQEKQVLEYLRSELSRRELTPLERYLLVGTHFQNMRSLSRQRRFRLESGLTPFPATNDSEHVSVLERALGPDLEKHMQSFDQLVIKASTPLDTRGHRIRDLEFSARNHQGGDIQFTPPELAREMVQAAGLTAGSRVLEPEAGIGNLAGEIRKVTDHVDCIEIIPDFQELLGLKGYNLVGSDLLNTPPNPIYDAVVMNPPFSSECRHIKYAFEFLKPGGTLVAVCSSRVENPRGKNYVDFFRWLDQQRYVFRHKESKFEKTSVPAVTMITLWR